MLCWKKNKIKVITSSGEVKLRAKIIYKCKVQNNKFFIKW